MNAINSVSDFLWSPPMVIYMLIISVILFFKSKMYRFFLPSKLKYFLSCKPENNTEKNQSQIKTFFTSVGSTIGTGSVIGSVCAYSIGGAGSLVYMCIASIVCASLCFCENILGAKYFCKNKICGAMGYIKEISPFMAAAYAVLTVFSSLGMGNSVQVNAISESASECRISKFLTAGIILAIMLFLTLFGIKGVFNFAGILVPVLAVGFMAGCIYIIADSHNLFNSIAVCLKNAFDLKSVSGGVVGTAISVGVRRGIFSTECGLGSTVSVHSQSCEGKPCVVQGIWAVIESFFDTFAVTAFTFMAVVCSRTDSNLPPMKMLAVTFENHLGKFGFYFIYICIILFALVSVSGWYCIGLIGWKYIFKDKLIWLYGILYSATACISCFLSMQAVWGIADIFNGFMMIINSSCLLLLAGNVSEQTEEEYKLSVSSSKAEK